MKPKQLLGLALVLIGGLIGCSTVPSEKATNEKSWQITLRTGVTNAAWMFPLHEPLGTMNYTVPAEAAKILESQPATELSPFLAKLRAEPPSWKAGVVDEWIIIVRDGLRGRRGVITNRLTTAKGIVSTNEIPVYTYADHFLRRTH